MSFFLFFPSFFFPFLFLVSFLFLSIFRSFSNSPQKYNTCSTHSCRMLSESLLDRVVPLEIRRAHSPGDYHCLSSLCYPVSERDQLFPLLGTLLSFWGVSVTISLLIPDFYGGYEENVLFCAHFIWVSSTSVSV